MFKSVCKYKCAGGQMKEVGIIIYFFFFVTQKTNQCERSVFPPPARVFPDPPWCSGEDEAQYLQQEG